MELNKNTNINHQIVLVTQPYVPPLEKYMKYVKSAFDNRWLTNGGPLLTELTERLTQLLDVKHLLIVNNGTSALQIAYQLKNLSNKGVITTPFTFPATSTALEWQNARVHLADIDPNSWNLCPIATEARLKSTGASAIVPVNIFGAPCDLEAFDKIGQEYNVPIIYDSAQALLSEYKGNSIFNYGDIHCISFHATKLFHCVEGGALVFNNEDDLKVAEKLINFGLESDGVVKTPGINAKMSELHAAMGLCVLDELPKLIDLRQEITALYQEELEDAVTFQCTDYPSSTPPMYMPVKFDRTDTLVKVQEQLHLNGFASRRYFNPNNNQYISKLEQPELITSNRISSNILCLPLMHDLDREQIKTICNIVKSNCK